MARKGTEGSAISLFSFQDIITSITGIMFLVVLLLVLMMITSKIPTAQDANKSSESVKELQKELAELKNKLQVLRDSQKKLDKEIEDLKKLSPEEIQRRKLELQKILKADQVKLDTLTTSLQLKEEQYKQLKTEYSELEKSVTLRKKVIEDLKKQLLELNKIVKEKETNRQQRSRVMKYVVHSNSAKQPVLAELDKDGIRFMLLDDKKIVDLRRPGRAMESLSLMALELQKLNSSQLYFSIAVKPGGFKYVIQLLELMKNNNFERGTEIMPDDDSSIFEEKNK